MTDELAALIQASRLPVKSTALEYYLEAQSALPGPRMNTQIAGAFADYVALSPDDMLLTLMRWTALSTDEAPVNAPREVLLKKQV